MVVLKSLSSKTELFDRIPFNPGVNIIMGKYSTEKRSDLNGIGKSTVVRLIDYLLLSESAGKTFFNIKKHGFLSRHKATLEFSDGDVIYFIERGFDEKDPIRFGSDVNNMKEYKRQELEGILLKIFFGDVTIEAQIKDDWFRDMISFFLKDDLDYKERRGPLDFFGSRELKCLRDYYNLYLLNIPYGSVIRYDTLSNETRQLNLLKKRIEQNIKDDTGGDDVKQSFELFRIDTEIRKIEESLKQFTFSDVDKDIEEAIDGIISERNKKRNRRNVLKRIYGEYIGSYQNEVEIDPTRVTHIYNEVKSELGDYVKKSLEEVLLIRKGLCENRARFLKDKIDSIKTEIEKLEADIHRLDEDKGLLYRKMDEKRAFDELKTKHSMLVDEKVKRERIAIPISQIKRINHDINVRGAEMSQKKVDIATEIDSCKAHIEKLRNQYFEIIKIKTGLNELTGARFSIDSDPAKRSSITFDIDIPKKYASGNASFKIFAYDLTIFFDIVENNRRLPHFLIHDGVFSGIDKGRIVNILNYINSKGLRTQEMQYIITANENDIQINNEGYTFDIEKCIVARFGDDPDSMFFKREY